MDGDNNNSEEATIDLICQLITNGDIDHVKLMLSQHDMKKVALIDSSGMTALQHACYRGNKEIVQFLLDQGADVNYTVHDHAYTALHFAALSGNSDVCLMLLLAGAKSHALNSVNRTPSQLAGFVGNHNCVAIINNFIPKSDVDYYTTIQGLQTEPSLPPELADSLYKYLMQINVHPVRLALSISKELLGEVTKVSSVMEMMVNREMKRGTETNEVLAVKIHYLRTVFCEVHKCGENGKGDTVETFIKRILHPTRGEEYMEYVIRESVRQFKFREGVLFQQMVKCLSKKDEAPSALSVIINVLNGHRGFASEDIPCDACGEMKGTKKCSKCKSVYYCSQDCQRLHWFVHKKKCQIINNDHSSELKEEKSNSNQIHDVSNKIEKLSV